MFRLTPREFNSYGSRRGNDAVMARGTFANIRLVNKFLGQTGPRTLHIPSGDTVSYIPLYILYLETLVGKILEKSVKLILLVSSSDAAHTQTLVNYK